MRPTALLVLLAWLSLAPCARGDENLRILTSTESAQEKSVAAAAAFEAWLRSEFARQVKRRADAFEKMIPSRSAGAAWQAERREFFLRQIGGLPERTPLNPQIVGTLQGKGYRVEKILLESRPNFHVTANLYLPESPPPWPAVLIACGHSHEGKAVGQYQRACILLARNGMAAMCYDPIGQGERYQILDSAGGHTAFVEAEHVPTPHPMVRLLCTTEHTMIGLGSALIGANVAQFRIWDGMRVIDYLQSRDDIITDKIGCAGNSGGGTETAYLMALDDRIVAAAPGCALTSFERLIATKGPQDGEQNIFGQIAFGLDQADYCIMAAPRAVLICAGVRDATFDFRGTWDLFLDAKRFYSRLGRSERIELNASDAPHGFTLQQREATARWMHRWLLGSEKAICEVDNLPDRLSDNELRAYNQPDWTPEQLQCTPKGQVLLLPGERSTFQINAETAARLRAERAAGWRRLSPTEQRQLVAKTIGARWQYRQGVPAVETLGTIERDGYSIRKLVLTTDGGVRVPALAFVPQKPTGPATLYLHGTSMTADAGPDGPLAALAKRGHVVLAAELRGIGETETGHDKKAFGKGRFGPDNLEIFLAYLIGKSFVGMRTDDALRWTAYLQSGRLVDRGPSEIHLLAIGEAAIPAMHAAVLAGGQFRTVTIRQMIASWETVVGAGETFNQSVNVVHGALQHYDLPDLLPLLGTDGTIITETIDPMGRPVAAKSAQAEVTVGPMTVVRERPGITGAGWASKIVTGTRPTDRRIQLLYPNHADDWGASTGTGASSSLDGGKTWKTEPDNQPLPAMVDQWVQQLHGGDLLAVGIRRLPDLKSRTESASSAGAGSAWVVGHSSDRGATWKISDCDIECPAALGVIARPLPPILHDAAGKLFMPAYAWSSTGHRALLLSSEDRGHHWSVMSTIAEASAFRAAGAAVTTPWFETTVARTSDGGWLAVVRTGSSARSVLMQVRSADGRTWERATPLRVEPNQRPVAGKLPSLLRLPNGALVLLTAHTKNHCRLYVSLDGSGNRWNAGHIITSQSGGNTCMTAIGADQLVVVTPANERLYAWPVTIDAAPRQTDPAIARPTDVSVEAGPRVRVRWTAPTDAANIVGYRVTPQLVAATNPEMEMLSYAPIETSDAATQLELGKVVSVGGRYRFSVAAIDREGRVSAAVDSPEAIVGVQPANPSR